jgi:hypothetical protein
MEKQKYKKINSKDLDNKPNKIKYDLVFLEKDTRDNRKQPESEIIWKS